MATFIAILAHLFIAGTLLALVYFAFRLVLAGRESGERAVRSLSIAAGFVAFLGAHVAGVDIASVFTGTMSHVGWPIAAAVSAVVPSAAGWFTAHWLLRGLNDPNNTTFAFRLMLMVISLVVLLLGEVYTTLALPQGVRSVGPAFLPNVCFILGLVLYLMKNWHAGRRRSQPVDADSWRV